MSCPYKDLFGAPGTGPHSIRFLGFAVVDTALTVLLALLTAFLTKTSFVANFVAWFVLGEVLHYAFGTNTAFLKLISMSPVCSATKSTLL